MSIITVSQKGSFDKTEHYLKKIESSTFHIRGILEKYGPMGVKALSDATPVDTGVTAESWYYQIVERSNYISLRWFNRNVHNGIPIAILLQYGHGTGTGGWVEGRNYIMPAVQPVFDNILSKVMEEVTKNG